MSVCSILVPKLEVDFFEFDPADKGIPKTTVAALKAILKAEGLKRTGLKADLIKRAQDNGLFPKLEGKHEPGPRWFYFDEAFGQGDHTVHYLCLCGAPMSLDEVYSNKKRRFSIKPNGVVYPSIYCGNRDCLYHIWGKLQNYDGGDLRDMNGYSYGTSHRKYDHERDKKNSRLYNNRIRY